MALLGWVPGSGDETKPYLDIAKQPRFIHNSSGRFEARFSSVTILESPAVLLKGMAGTSLGVWVAHGEGGGFSDRTRTVESHAIGGAHAVGGEAASTDQRGQHRSRIDDR